MLMQSNSYIIYIIYIYNLYEHILKYKNVYIYCQCNINCQKQRIV